MSLAFKLVTGSIKGLSRMLCQVEAGPLSQVPQRGPLILVCNHINFLDAPVVFSHLQPRPVTGLVKAETWEDPLLGPLFSLWGGIPLQRGEPDREALRLAWEALEQGKILVITPEGTRSNHGRLQRGQPGIVTLALRANAPLLPVAYYGHEVFHQNFRRARRSAFHIRVGRPFWLAPPEGRLDRAMRQELTDEIMYQLALLLPERNRGVYADGAGSGRGLRFE